MAELNASRLKGRWMLDYFWFCCSEQHIWVLFPVPMFQTVSGDNFGIFTWSIHKVHISIRCVSPTKYLLNIYLTFNLCHCFGELMTMPFTWLNWPRFTNHLRLNVIFFLMFHLVHNLVHPTIDATNKMKGTAKSLLSTVTVNIRDSIGIN